MLKTKPQDYDTFTYIRHGPDFGDTVGEVLTFEGGGVLERDRETAGDSREGEDESTWMEGASALGRSR